MTRRAVTYRRVSSRAQVDNTSLADQLDRCTRYATEHGYELVGDYCDPGLSGASTERPEWLRMLGDAVAGEFEVLLMVRFDRFGRGSLFTAEIERLVALGIEVAFVDQPIDLTTDEGMLMFGLTAPFAAHERRLFARRTMAGRRAKLAAGGQYVGGTVPYGYRVVGQGREARVLPDDDERRALRLAYNRIVNDGWSTPMVCAELDQLGLKPRRAQTWTSATLRRHLRHDVLVTGRVTWGAPRDQTARGRDRSTKLSPLGTPVNGDPITVEYGNPMLTEVEWTELQRALDGLAAKRSLRGDRQQTSQLMTGRIQGVCGATYYGVSLVNSTKSQTSHAYRCGGRRSTIPADDRCDDGQINGPWLDEWVWTSVVGILTDGDRLTVMARDWLATLEVEPDELRALIEQRDRLTGLRDRALEAMLTSDTLAPILRQRAEEAEQHLRDVQARIDAAQATHAEQASRRREVLDLVTLVSGARERLVRMDSGSRAEVVRILNVRVKAGPVYRGRPTRAEITMDLDGLGDLASSETGEQASSPPRPSAASWPRCSPPARCASS